VKFILIGQPNCGKSTLFNQVAGYRAETGNFSGTTVSFTETKVRVTGEVVELVDLPGTYTLLGTNPAERVVLDYLVKNGTDVIINVVDATHLQQSLALTIELVEFGLPLIVGVNMLDEAKRQGITIDGPGLSKELGVPVLPLIASRGQGVRELFNAALLTARNHSIPPAPQYEKGLEKAITTLEGMLNDEKKISRRAIVIKLLEGDPGFTDLYSKNHTKLQTTLHDQVEILCHPREQQAMWLIASQRHSLAEKLTKQTMTRGVARSSWRDKMDNWLLHPFWGYVCLVGVLAMFFTLVYGFGTALEKPLSGLFTQLEALLGNYLDLNTLVGQIAIGLLQGVSGGLSITLPYLVPFLFGLGLMEDIGYLPRIAFLMDSLMHRMGLHGKAIVPFILGFGCNVPAIMSTRIMEDRRDRILAATLATMVPCAARLAVVFGLIAFYLGPIAALGIYVINLIVIALVGKILTHFLPDDSPGIILEMPVYRVPTLRTVTAKMWFRVREFLVEAWPILIIGSVILALLNYFSITPHLDILFRPVTWLIGLPSQVGTPLIFGIFRKELSLIMLGQALGSTNFASVLTSAQMVSYTLFVVFYVPCLATMVAIRNELGTKAMLAITALTMLVATSAALAARLVLMLF